MTHEEIQQQAELFFTFPGDEKTVVTYASSLLFAEHCVKEAMTEESDLVLIAHMQGYERGKDVGRREAARECVKIAAGWTGSEPVQRDIEHHFNIPAQSAGNPSGTAEECGACSGEV